jgi:hypothetical protein
MQLKNHDKIIAESLDMLRKIQSLPQYVDRSLYEMSIRHLLVERLSDEDFRNVSDNLTTAFENLEKLDDVMNKLVFHELESQPNSETTTKSSRSFGSDSVEAGQAKVFENEEKFGKLGSPKPFIDTVPEVKEYLDTLKTQVKMALARLSDLDTSSDTFGQWLSNFSIGGAFKKFRDYVPLLQASNELALKTQTFVDGLMKGIEAIKDRYAKVLKPFLKDTKAAGDMTIEQIMAATGKDPEKVRKKIESDIRKSMDAGKFKQAFSALKSKINFLPGLRKSLVGPVEDLTNTIPKMPEEIAKSLMGVKLSNLSGDVDFRPKPIDSSDAQDTLKDTEEAAKELKDKVEDADKTPEVSEQESQELESKAREALKDSAIEASKLNEPIDDVISDMLTRWKNSADPLTRQHALTDEVVRDLEDGLNKAIKDSDRDNIKQKVDTAIVSWASTHQGMLSRKGSNMGITPKLQDDLIEIIPKLVDYITEKKQEGKISYSYASIEKIVHSCLNRKYGRIISESKRLQRWQLLAGLK